MTLLPGETLDSIVYPDLRIIQPTHGYRFSLDPLLLWSFLDHRPKGPLIDLGCGSGVLALLLARRWPGLTMIGLEIQASLAGRAARSVRLNRLGGQVTIVQGDVRRCPYFLRQGSFGTVVGNPPYHPSGSGRLPPDPERAVARHEILMSLEDLVAAADHLLTDDGMFLFSWKPERRAELEEGLARRRLGITRLRFVRSRPGDEPFLLLCRGGRLPHFPSRPEVIPPLDVYRGRDYTPEVGRILGRLSSASSGDFQFSRIEIA